MDNDKLLTLKQVCERHPGVTLRTLRFWMLNRDENGLSDAVVKIGKRTLILEKRFQAWIESHREGHSGRNELC